MSKAKKKSFCILKGHIDRSSNRKCSVRKGVLRNFAKLTGKQQCQGLFFNEVAIKKESLALLLSCEFCEISKNTFFTEHLWATASVLKFDRLHVI